MQKRATIIPPRLQTGDQVICLSPSGKVDAAEVAAGEKKLQELLDLEVKRGVHAFDVQGRFAGRDRDRLQDLQQALDDPAIKAIFCNRGGYGISRIIDQIDWKGFLAHPKWLIGYSDITLLHAAIQQLGFASIHAPMTNTLGKQEAQSTLPLLKYLLKTSFPFSWSFPLTQFDRPKRIRGRLVGGNLSMVCHSLGTRSWDLRDGDILCLEEVGEPLYKVERMLIQLGRAGVFEKVGAVLFGYMTRITGSEEMGGRTEDTLQKLLAPYGLSYYFGLPFGHEFPHYPMVLGAEVEIIPDTALAYLHFMLSS